MKLDGIIFDLDGTLWNSSEVVLKAWNQILSEKKEIKKPITKDEMKSIMGLQLWQIGEKLFPYLEKEDRLRLMEVCCDYENELIKIEGGVLYPRLEETLQQLSEKYKLFIVSNCQCGYIEAFFHYHGLEKFFTDIECAGKTGLSKGETIKLVMKRNGIEKAIYVGDTQGDCDAAKLSGIPFIYASYGFGDVKEYDYILKEISEIVEIIKY
jgi:phosphoglycolate phosphatase